MVFLGALACWLALASAEKHSQQQWHTTEFVEAQGTQLYVGAQPFRYLGANAYWLMAEASYSESGRRNVQTVLDDAVALGVSVVRTWAFADGSDEPHLQVYPGQFDQNMLQALDYVIAQAAQRGLRLLMPLLNYWGDYGGIPQYSRWNGKQWQPGDRCPDFFRFACRQLQLARSRPFVRLDRTALTVILPSSRLNQMKEQYKQMVTAITSHRSSLSGLALRDDPTIMGWELCNECRCRESKGELQAPERERAQEASPRESEPKKRAQERASPGESEPKREARESAGKPRVQPRVHTLTGK